MTDPVKESVQKYYGRLAEGFSRGQGGSCCSGTRCGCGNYNLMDLAGVPSESFHASLGCGNPTALAEIPPGSVVLDLGSGAGLDAFLAARQVGEEGKVYGLDMTDEMLDLARRNQEKSGLDNVEFIKGDLENIPLPEGHIDVIISNCVLNLTPDKKKALSEAWRVLKPGGRLAVSDIVWLREVPDPIREDMELWAGCITGALYVEDLHRLLREAGFSGIDIGITHVFNHEDIPEETLSQEEKDKLTPWAGSLASAFIQARKPAGDI